MHLTALVSNNRTIIPFITKGRKNFLMMRKNSESRIGCLLQQSVCLIFEWTLPYLFGNPLQTGTIKIELRLKRLNSFNLVPWMISNLLQSKHATPALKMIGNQINAKVQTVPVNS